MDTPGHTMTAVRLYDACVVLDPGLGNLFYVEDNSRLATVEELLEKPELAGRSSPHAEHYFRDPHLVFFERHSGGEFPEHAPAG